VSGLLLSGLRSFAAWLFHGYYRVVFAAANVFIDGVLMVSDKLRLEERAWFNRL